MRAAELLNLRGGDLAVRVRHGQHFVAGVFDRAGLVHGDVAGVRRDDAPMGTQDRGDHGAVDLRAAMVPRPPATQRSLLSGAGSGGPRSRGVCSPFVFDQGRIRDAPSDNRFQTVSSYSILSKNRSLFSAVPRTYRVLPLSEYVNSDSVPRGNSFRFRSRRCAAYACVRTQRPDPVPSGDTDSC